LAARLGMLDVNCNVVLGNRLDAKATLVFNL
jgi:hypothetical protein